MDEDTEYEDDTDEHEYETGDDRPEVIHPVFGPLIVMFAVVTGHRVGGTGSVRVYGSLLARRLYHGT
jgi:hypothetical protein